MVHIHFFTIFKFFTTDIIKTNQELIQIKSEFV